MARRCFLSLTSALFLGVGTASASSIETEELQLTDNSVEDRDPKISDTHTVFVRRDAADGLDVYHIEAAGDPTLVVGGAGDQFDPDIDFDPAIADYRIVLVDDSLGRENVAAVELTSGDREDLTSFGASVEVDNHAPAISAGWVVWVERDLRAVFPDTNRDDIRFQDLNSAGSQQCAACFAWNQSAPAIDGNLVSHQNGNSAGAWDLRETFVPNFVTFGIDSSAGDQLAPSVSGSQIAYISNGDVRVYDEPSVTRTWITRDAFEQRNVRIDGDIVVYNDDRNGNLDIFLHDLLDGREHQLTSDPSDQVLGDLDGNRIVFHDDRLGNLEIWEITFTINHCPVAEAGDDRSGAVGVAVTLEGSATDPDLEPIVSWQWTLDGPAASAAEILDSTAQDTSFVPDIPGEYLVSLVASDGSDTSAPATFVVDVPAPVPSVEVLRCDVIGDQVEFLWRRPRTYDVLEIYRDGELFDTPPVHTARFRDTSPGPGLHTYEIRGLVGSEPSQPRRCVAEVEDLPVLTPGCDCTVTLTPGRRRAWYRFDGEPGSTVVISLDGQDELDSNALYVGWGEPATEWSFDQAANSRRSSDQKLVIDQVLDDPLYVLAQANFFNGEDNIVDLAVEVVDDIALTRVVPDVAGAGGAVRILVEGAGFDTSTVFALAGTDAVEEQTVLSSTTAAVTLNLEIVDDAGSYDLTAREAGGEVTIPFEVLAAVEEPLEVELSGAQFARFERRFGLDVRVRNPGTSTHATPLLRVRPPQNAALRFADETVFQRSGADLELLGLPGEGLLDQLGPFGESAAQLLFLSSPRGTECFPGEDCPVEFQALLFDPSPADEIGWETRARPDGVPEADWAVIRDALSADVGPLWSDYAAALARTARRLLEESGARESSTTELLRELVRGLLPDLDPESLPEGPLVPPSELFSPVSSWEVIVIGALDPNEKTGEAGPDNLGISYRIEFENEGSAAAQNIVVEDIFFDTALLDLESFRFHLLQIGADSDAKSIAFDTEAFAVSGAIEAEYATSDPLADLTETLVVTYDLDLDTQEGRFRVIINTEPAEPGALLSVFSGALPVNDDDQRGAGHVDFSVKLKGPLGGDDSIQNQGLISFDGFGCTHPETEVLERVCRTSVVTITAADFDIPGELTTHWVEQRDGRFSAGWEPPDRAGSYAVFLWQDGAAEPDQPLAAGLTSPFVALGEDLAPGVHRWRVVASNFFGEQPGPEWSFDTSSPVAEEPALVSPADGSTVAAGVVPLRWSGGTPDSTQHTVWLWRSDGRRPRHPLASSLPIPELDVATAAIGVRYSWQVVLVDPDSGDATPGPVWSFQIAGSTFRRADSNADGGVDIADVLHTLFSLFQGGPEAVCAKSADANDDGAIDIPDVIFTLSYLFLDGPAPPPPFSRCGDEFTPDDSTTCASFPPCE